MMPNCIIFAIILVLNCYEIFGKEVKQTNTNDSIAGPISNMSNNSVTSKNDYFSNIKELIPNLDFAALFNTENASKIIDENILNIANKNLNGEKIQDSDQLFISNGLLSAHNISDILLRRNNSNADNSNAADETEEYDRHDGESAQNSEHFHIDREFEGLAARKNVRRSRKGGRPKATNRPQTKSLPPSWNSTCDKIVNGVCWKIVSDAMVRVIAYLFCKIY